MSGDNPFAQWMLPHLVTDQERAQSSIFGALPSGPSSTPIPLGAVGGYGASSPSSPTHPQIMTFQFMSPSKSVLNSVVMGPQGQRFFTIATHGVGNTLLINEQPGTQNIGEAIGQIEWQKHPYVALMDAVAKQTSAQWMALSSDRRYRTMMVRGKMYSWVPSSNMICCYTAGHNPSEFVARIVNGRDGVMVAVDITVKAVQAGLLDVCVLAAILFSSGRNID